MNDTTERPTTYAVGDHVTADPTYFGPSALGVVYTIEKVPVGRNGVNYVAKPKDNPTGRGIKAPAYALLPATDADLAAIPGRAGVMALPYVPTPEAGTVVYVERVTKVNPRHAYVVLGDARKPNCVKLVKLGGEGGRYFPAIPVDRCTVIPVAELAEFLTR